jgi:hypothetical protein
MPNIQVDLPRALYAEKGDQLSTEIHQAQIDVLGVPEDDLFQIFRPHEDGELKFSPTYGGVDRQNLIFIRITMVHMYSVATKQKLFRAMVERLGTLGVRSEDILIAVVENGFEDWYAGTF